MQEITTEMALSIAVIVLTIIAIAVFIISGAGLLFYALFVAVVIVMFYTWQRISAHEPTATVARPAQAQHEKRRAASKPRQRRRKRSRA